MAEMIIASIAGMLGSHCQSSLSSTGPVGLDLDQFGRVSESLAGALPMPSSFVSRALRIYFTGTVRPTAAH
jgi:hypothetical protein